MKACVTMVVLLSATVAWPAQPARAADEKPKIKIIIYDFHCAEGAYGAKVSDSLRLRLARHLEFDVLDGPTTQDFSTPTPADARQEDVLANMKKMAMQVGIYGTLVKSGSTFTADVRCIDLRNPDKSDQWSLKISDSTERARGEMARQIVERLRGEKEWVAPQVGDELEPDKFPDPPVNVNGTFERGRLGWDHPDNVSTFLERGPSARGTILRVRTDLARDPWLEYTRALRLGLANPLHPPKIATDTSYGCVGGLEGVHYRSDWIKATPGQRYWLTADCKTPGGKIFIKGYRDWGDQADGLPEVSMVQLKITPQAFAKLPPARQKQMIREDSRKYPERYRRECYRWFLNLGEGKPIGDGWKHEAGVVPPRGGLPDNVQYLSIQVYSYWPPGTYLYDNVHLYKDPRQKAPVAVEAARTPNFGKTSDLIERADSIKDDIKATQELLRAAQKDRQADKVRALTARIAELNRQLINVQREMTKYQDGVGTH